MNAHPVINAHSPQMLQNLGDNASPNFGQNSAANGNNVVIQNQHLLQSPNNSGGFIVGSSNNMQQVILNNSNLLSHGGSLLQTATPNLLQNNNGNLISASGQTTSTKILSNSGNSLIGTSNLINQTNVQMQSGSLLSPNGGMVGQQTVVLNQLSSGGYMIQPQTIATVDGQVLNVISPDGNATSNSGQFIHHHQHTPQPRIIVSPDTKRRTTIKRKNAEISPSTPQNLSPLPSPTVQHQSQQPQQQLLQIQSQYQSQGFQISPGGAGITLVQNKNPVAQQQQILLQNSQTILQPINLIGQQVLVPAGVMINDAATLLQIQNVNACNSIITPQGMVLRTAQSTQNKNFLSPNAAGAANQQFIVNGNGQISPIGQMYNTPMGLVVPQSNTNNSFVQQNTTVVQEQQQAMMAPNVSDADASTQTVQATINSTSVLPPDTTTHSPHSPDRPPSAKSVGNDINMVKFNLILFQL